MRVFLFYLGSLLIMLSCGSQNISIQATEWKLIEMNGNNASSINPDVTLNFKESRQGINGFGGCNRFFGKYEMADAKLKITGLGSTKMYCQDKMSMEDNYFAMLQKVDSFQLVDEQLILLAEGQPVLKFRK